MVFAAVQITKKPEYLLRLEKKQQFFRLICEYLLSWFCELIVITYYVRNTLNIILLYLRSLTLKAV